MGAKCWASEGTSRVRNGIAFDANGALYANASFTGDVYRYDVFGPETPRRELFGNVHQADDGLGFKSPDGMKFGADGRLYCVVYGQQNVTVLDSAGNVADRLALDGPNPTNCAFSLSGQTLYVTEVSKGQVEALPVPCAGLALHQPKLDLRRISPLSPSGRFALGAFGTFSRSFRTVWWRFQAGRLTARGSRSRLMP